MPGRPALALLASALLGAAGAGCARGPDADAKARVLAPVAPPAPAPPPPDLAAPRPLLALDAGEAARRLGSFEWRGQVRFTVTRQGDSAARLQVAERHHLRQLATGEFEVESEVDAGGGPGALTGKHLIFAGGLTYARNKYAPWRERPTDRGRDARRYREESFGLLADLARLYGAALVLTPTGADEVLGRPVRRYLVSLSADPAAPAAEPSPRVFGSGGPDEDTRRHLAFLDGRVPVAAGGELLLDEATGVPLRAKVSGAFSLKDDPRVRVQLELSSDVKALGGRVGAVAAPKGALPDSRKPAGVAAALEAAGLRVKEKKGADEPADDPDAP